MAKRVDPLKAKQAKQKKLAIVLGVVLVAVGAFQGPKTLKMLQGPQPVASASTTPTPPAAPSTPAATPAAPTTPGALPAPAAAPQEAVLADSDLPPAASQSQLLSFEQFETKDPFAQQVEGAGSSDSEVGPAEDGAAPSTEPVDTSGGGPNVDPGTGFDPLGSNPQDQDPNADPPSFTAPESGTGSPGSGPEKSGPEPAAATTISVNGAVEEVATKASFPADEPVFQLVSLAKDGKSVRLGIAGGSYASGEPTVKLELGKTLTLQNTADGSRYELKLLTVQGFAPPKRTK
jgi:hypothetical protein